VCKDTELKEVYFTTPLALASAEGGIRKYFKGNGKDPRKGLKGLTPGKGDGKGDGKDRKGRDTGGNQGFGGKTPGMFAGFTLLTHTPDGRQICYAFNSARGCKGNCGRVHVCRVKGCGKQHGVHQHPGASAAPKDSTGGADQTENFCVKAGGCSIAPCRRVLSVALGIIGRGLRRCAAMNILMVFRGCDNLLHSKSNLITISFFKPLHQRMFALILGVLPASPWEWAEVLDLIPRGAVTFALYQCHYGALTSKPTRFLSNLPSWRAAVPHFPGLPSLDDDGRYRGPLPPRCGHKHADLLRSQPNGWQSGNIARFTPELCSFVARAALAVAPQEKGAQHSPPATTDNTPAAKNLSSPPSESASLLSAAGASSGMVTGEAASTADPESFASSLLKSGIELTRNHLLDLYKLLPREKPPRLLCAYWKQVLPLLNFTTITLLEDVQTPLHRDGRNGSTHNAILAVSDFEQGGLWLEDEHGDETRLLDGQELRGKVHQITKDPFVFEARDRYHCTEPWKGHRLVMVAFTVPGYEKLESSDLALVRDLGFVLDGKSQLEGKAVAFRPELCCNRGNPINVMWAGDEWVPSARGQGLPEPARRLAAAMHKLVKSFVLRVLPNVERTAMELVLGRFTSSPFSERDMAQLRQQWVGLLGDTGGHDLLVVPERQPFYLPALARTAELLGDPDWEVITQGEDNFCTGVPLGCEEVLPQVPQVFDFKHKSRTLDESEFDWDRTNYK
ncbi:unnamed protein product, partial [Symbiodinium sp. CCMP2456]